ncbi:hypothetical protein C2857_006756 [Epichloe festucae Fl1]|uniref:Uncharacterized protein n=1 Tax=Epichloe festucae (strain Fl1) TaxID=877507 RepID=A0A7S9KLV7_EPIFF|nr:hypothetical protein C2857_006756 [Epichloe festucae Fl1]
MDDWASAGTPHDRVIDMSLSTISMFAIDEIRQILMTPGHPCLEIYPKTAEWQSFNVPLSRTRRLRTCCNDCSACRCWQLQAKKHVGKMALYLPSGED